MPKRRLKIPLQKLIKRKKRPAPAKQVEYLLEQTDLASLKEAKRFSEDLLKYNWKFYYELAQQRDSIIDKIKASLLGNISEKFSFQKWQRAVKWKYSLHPMCTNGSKTFVGQRFNYGDEINSEIQGFSCLYLATDKDTALQETLGQVGTPINGLSPQEIALTNAQSECIVSVSGSLDQIIDLRSSKSLVDFTDLIKDFSLSKELQDQAKLFGDNPSVITTPKLLLDSILDKDWRDRSVQFQIPANSQIFGNLVAAAGIQGILYPSKLTGKDCLAIFTQNFGNSDSFLKFDDHRPDERVPEKIDSSNFEITQKSYEELIHN